MLLLLLFNDLPLFITTITTVIILSDTIVRLISRIFSSMWSLATIIVHMPIIMTVMTTIVMEIRVVVVVIVVVGPFAFFRFEMLLLIIIM